MKVFTLLFKAHIELTRKVGNVVSVFLMFLLEKGLLLVYERKLVSQLLLEMGYCRIKLLGVFFNTMGERGVEVVWWKGHWGGR